MVLHLFIFDTVSKYHLLVYSKCVVSTEVYCLGYNLQPVAWKFCYYILVKQGKLSLTILENCKY